MNQHAITVKTFVRAPIQTVWERWNGETHITHWAFALDTWEAPWAKNDLRPGGNFTTRMQAKDGSFGFDLKGTYSAVKEPELIEYALEDGRQVSVQFTPADGGTEIVETFEPENQNPPEMQRGGWQAILDNFKKYAESA